MRSKKVQIWMPVKGFEGRYEVSNLGVIRSLVTPDSINGGIHIRKIPRLLCLPKNKNGYVKAPLSKDGKTYHKLAHRIVAEAFLDNPNNKPQVNHINGIKHDNRIENLEWSTCSENIAHSFNSCFRKAPSGDECPVSKLSSKDVMAIFNSKKPGTLLAKEYSVHPMTISDIKTGRSWSTVTKKIYSVKQ